MYNNEYEIFNIYVSSIKININSDLITRDDMINLQTSNFVR